MIIRTRVPQFGKRRPRDGRDIAARVRGSLEQSRRDKEAACDHWFVKQRNGAGRVCVNCGAQRSHP